MHLSVSEPSAFDEGLFPRNVVAAGRCFIGLSAADSPVDTVWLRHAIPRLLAQHEYVLILLETELESYDGGADLTAAAPVLHPTAASKRITAHTISAWYDADAVRAELAAADQARVQLASWSHFSDSVFANLWRLMLSALGVSVAFRRDVRDLWARRRRELPLRLGAVPAASVACLREIESLAMRLRVGEVAGYHHEYGRGPEALLASQLYAGAYARDGLTVEELVGFPPRRAFRRLD